MNAAPTCVPPHVSTTAPAVIVMGVSGSGKSTLARQLAAHLGWPFLEGDDVHPASNREKMAAGIPLNDDDRWPWLEQVAAWIQARGEENEACIVACSALKRAYRDALRSPRTVFCFLDGDRDLVLARLSAREGHFMPASLLDSQFADLERPTSDENTIQIDLSLDPEQQVEAALHELQCAGALSTTGKA